jgi:hypothetical protein
MPGWECEAVSFADLGACLIAFGVAFRFRESGVIHAPDSYTLVKEGFPIG